MSKLEQVSKTLRHFMTQQGLGSSVAPLKSRKPWGVGDEIDQPDFNKTNIKRFIQSSAKVYLKGLFFTRHAFWSLSLMCNINPMELWNIPSEVNSKYTVKLSRFSCSQPITCWDTWVSTTHFPSLPLNKGGARVRVDTLANRKRMQLYLPLIPQRADEDAEHQTRGCASRPRCWVKKNRRCKHVSDVANKCIATSSHSYSTSVLCERSTIACVTSVPRNLSVCEQLW